MAGNPARMAQKPADRDLALVGLGEFWPVASHWRVEVEYPALDKDVSTECHHALGSRGNTDQRVLLPGPSAGRVGVATPEVDDWLAVHIDTDSGAHLCAFSKILRESVPYRCKT